MAEPEDISGKDELRLAVLRLAEHRESIRAVASEAHLGKTTIDELAVARRGAPVIVCVTGMGGLGKTELVVQWADTAADRFPDGCVFMDLRGFDHKPPVRRTDALLALIHELGGGAEVPRKRRNREARYRTLVTGRQLLLIFDNVRDARHVQSLIPPTDSCVTVITSRDDLTALHALHGVRRIALEPLHPEAARELFGEMAGIDVATAPPLVNDLVDGCGGHPLALRLAGGLAAGRNRRQVEGLLRDLGQDGGPLRILRAGTGRADLSDVFTWSYRSLDGPPRPSVPTARSPSGARLRRGRRGRADRRERRAGS
ncbi:NB-ARC domain-containing protein [Actinoplanes sp. NBC_00393]|uniref:NB-ARC domain-containing protein n=1 Tax=Actinoplanes sp. NBC_00393 TaxID=2975953 RepID=UPI002E235313